MATVNSEGLLRGQVAVVTGASRGIGEAIARRFAMEGARVVISARTQNEADHVLSGSLNTTVEQIRAAGGEVVAVRADLYRSEDRAKLIEAAVEVYGPVDILVNNAAITYYEQVLDFTEKRFRLMMEVQVRAPFELAQLVLPGMIERGGGWILNVSSGAARHPDDVSAPGRGSVVYGMCKAALERFTTGLAQEMFAHNIGVNVISPGLVATPGAVYHNLVNDQTRHLVVPVEYMAESCLRLVHGNPRELTGRIDRAPDVVKEFNLEPTELI